MRKRSLLLLTGLVALVASLVIGPAATATTEGASAGTVVIVHDQEPAASLNNFISEGNGYTNSLVMNLILAGGVIYDNKVKLKPYLLEGLPKILQKEPLKATMTYKANANWSDGKPVTGADFMALYRTIMNPNWDITSREGLRGHRQDPGEGQVRHGHLQAQAGLRGVGRPAREPRRCPRTRSPARTSTSSGRTRSTSRAVPSSSRAGRRARSSRS